MPNGSLTVNEDLSIEEVPAVVSSVGLQPPVPTNQVLIVDAMSVLQSMTKLPGMMKICHLKEAFVRKIDRMTNVYDKARIIFDRYIEESLKARTRAKRAISSAAASSACCDLHDQMSIKPFLSKNLYHLPKQKKE